MRTRDILRKAANLIEQTGWTHGVLAREADGMSTGPCNKEAICFCAIGAICRVVGADSRTNPEVKAAMAKFASFLTGYDKNYDNDANYVDPVFRRIYVFNDGQERDDTGKAKVISALRKAANTYGSNSK